MITTLLVLLPMATGEAAPVVSRPVMGIVRFAPRGQAPGADWIGAVLTEALQVRLRRLHRWRWADPQALARAVAAEKPAATRVGQRAWGGKVGRAAGVDVLVSGVFDRVGVRLDVALRMVRVKGEEGLGSVSVNGRLTEMRTVITRLTEAVVAGLHLKLDAAQQRVIRRPISLISQAIEWFGRGVALEGDPKRQREAAAAYLRAVSLDNTLAEAHYRLGLLYRRAGEASGSIDHLQTAVRLGGQQPHHLVALADGLAGAGRHVAAYVRLNQALETDPLCADAYALLGHLYLSQGRHREAEPVLRQATELDPRPVQPWCDLGNLLFVTGHLKEAAASYRSALQGDPGHVQAMNNLGMVYLEQGRFDEAEKQFTAAVAADPNGAHGHHNMARLRSAQRRFAEAVPHARRACKLAANDARMWLTLGQTLARAGALPEAVPALQKAVVLDRTDLIARQARLQLERIRQAQPDLFRP